MNLKYLALGLCLAALSMIGYIGWTAFGGSNCCAAVCSSVSKSCKTPCVNKVKALNGYSEEDQRVINYVADIIKEYDGDLAKVGDRLDPKNIAKEIGIDSEGKDENYVQYLQPGIMTALNERKVDMDKLISSSNCTKFAACSVDQNLAAATGEELERYQLEKAEDGKFYEGWEAPDFQFKSLDGTIHSLSDYEGKKVALMLFAVHCNHCYATIPMISELHEEFDSEELTILPVYVNKRGLAKDETVEYFKNEFDLKYDLMVSLNKDIGELFNARMVPSTFLIDEQGNVTRKFVGQKDKMALAEAFGKFTHESI